MGIVALAYLLIIGCVIQFGVGIILIFFAIFLPNDGATVFRILQWTFALLAVCFPWIGMLSAWKTILSGLICFDLYLLAQLIWNILHIIGLAILAPLANKIAQIIVAGIEIVIALILMAVTSAMSALLLNYYRMQE